MPALPPMLFKDEIDETDESSGFFVVTPKNTTVDDLISSSRLITVKEDAHAVLVRKNLKNFNDHVDPVLQIQNVTMRYPYRKDFKRATFSLNHVQKKLFTKLVTDAHNAFETEIPNLDVINTKCVDYDTYTALTMGKRYNIMVSIRGVYSFEGKLYFSFALESIEEVKSSKLTFKRISTVARTVVLDSEEEESEDEEVVNEFHN